VHYSSPGAAAFAVAAPPHLMTDGTIDTTRIVLRPIGSPLPLGLLALVPAGVMLSCQQIGAIDVTEGRTIAFLLLGFVVPLQFAATILAFLARDSVAGTGLGLFSGAWLASALTLLNAKPGSTSHAFGVFLLSVGAGMIVVVAGASFGKVGPALVITVGAVRFVLSGLYELTANTGVEHAAAVIGFILAGVALYSAVATEVEDVSGPKLPLGRRGPAKAALEEPLSAQLARIEHEAGVREQL
jgi:succinate-acetate transporter protein